MKHNQWTNWLRQEWEQEYFVQLSAFLKKEYALKRIYPPKNHVFSAFSYCDYADIKVVIIGQDPYHQPNQAHGLCFSVNPGIKIPPSLLNIYKELQMEYGYAIPDNGCLIPWAKQGVFLLNTVMTVEDSRPQSHANKGWEIFTDHVIQKINEKQEAVVFLLWGRSARSKAVMIDQTRHLVLEAAHPSPLSAHGGFFGCGHFQKANAFLQKRHRTGIDWKINNL